MVPICGFTFRRIMESVKSNNSPVPLLNSKIANAGSLLMSNLPSQAKYTMKKRGGGTPEVDMLKKTLKKIQKKKKHKK